MSEHRIADNMEVSLHFRLRLEDGTEVDSTFDKTPASFQVGDGNLPPGFERSIMGMAAGETGSFTITPEHAFGQHNPQNVQTVARKSFDEEIEVGMVMSFAEPSGSELPGIIREIDERDVKVDFNHPLAGRTLTFEVEVLSVAPATTH
ncbi:MULTISPECIES: FKBP-type peptidyl-prolyl cis-trans isomerase [Cobetia]|uniref:FKBP-type peptidyl-prolyl cis-trans isomerase n=1 Tax=Cobetia TaxID=204286 RepID=UPI0015821DC0|nr:MULTISPECIES: FKBP-type peptidyl-prolyl cis-trans isomerase [Cobetia]MDI4662273.1 FKBP-type peptidyl-prolyl cis-trans isomerase [Cobetia sp. BMC6]MDL2192558.1 FKBP-type peptidyl-prolyl cis-trans isomerase [Cobetia sp. LC6]NUJ57391.1 FKBP-type peptidyl-prolyl cis-trans isomerase [Cobetia marina]